LFGAHAFSQHPPLDQYSGRDPERVADPEQRGHRGRLEVSLELADVEARDRPGTLAWHTRDWEFDSGDVLVDYEGRPTRGLALPDTVLRKIFRENDRRWLSGIGV
jgi:hypothetical protein